MANIVYTKFLEQQALGNINWTSAVIRVLLERSTSTYTPNKDHDFLDSFTTGGGVEISVASYSRLTIASPAVNIDDVNDRIEHDHNDLAFGNLESGQTADALIYYVQVGGDDTTPANDILICYVDTDSGGVLPAALGGGAFNVNINLEGLLQGAQA